MNLTSPIPPCRALRTAIITVATLACVGAMSFSGRATDFSLFYLGGQSNMDGYGKVAELESTAAAAPEDVWIFHGNPAPDGAPVDGRGIWAPLGPGHGAGFASDGTTNRLSGRFGLELTFAETLRKLRPNQPIAIVKYSRGGTSIAIEAAANFGSWDPDFAGGTGAGNGINQYDHFLHTLRAALSTRDIDGDGESDRLIPAGILWMQGESDSAHGEAVARRYEANLKRMIDLFRAALWTDDLPVVIGRISDSRVGSDDPVWKHGDIVRTAQADFVAADAQAALVTSTDRYGYSDPWHYDTAGFLDLGIEFARGWLSLIDPETANRIPQPGRPRVLLLGDSISIGYTAGVREALSHEADVFRPTRPSGNAENCAGTTKGIANIERWTAMHGGGWDVIHFNFGLHDLKRVKPGTGRNSTSPDDPRQAEPEIYRSQLTRIVEALKKTGAGLVFATTTPVPPGGVRPHRDVEDPARYNAIAIEIMQANGIAVNDLHAAVLPRLGELQKPVDVHFTPEGSAFLAERVAHAVRQALPPQP